MVCIRIPQNGLYRCYRARKGTVLQRKGRIGVRQNGLVLSRVRARKDNISVRKKEEKEKNARGGGEVVSVLARMV